MAGQKFKLAVNNAKFPFLFSRASRAVSVPGLDVAPRTGVGFVGSAESFDYNLAQMLFCENVLPTADGLISVAALEDIPAISPAATDFDQVFLLRDVDENNLLYAPGRGKNYLYDTESESWISYNPFVFDSQYSLVSRAYVNGRTFICYESTKIIEWDPVAEEFVDLVLTLPAGYTITDIRSICGAQNYLLLFSQTEVFWSSTLDLLNFDDPIGSSGRQIPVDLKGQITGGVPISGGVIIYTIRNAVAAFFTNNAATPFSFREVQGSGGVQSYEQVSGDANASEHYLYGSAGLQVLNLQRAEAIMPDCTDFLAGRQCERWNRETKEVEEFILQGELRVKIQLLGNRYLFISYGFDGAQYEFALIHDLSLRRWGKIRTPHVDVSLLPSEVMAEFGYRYYELTDEYQVYDLEYGQLNQPYGNVLPIRAGYAFVRNTGQVDTLLADPAADVNEGVAVFGHVQLTRQRTVTFCATQMDGLYSVPTPVVSILGSEVHNGYERTEVYTPTLAHSSPRQVEYKGRKTFENFDVAIEGKFVLSSAFVSVTNHGSR